MVVQTAVRCQGLAMCIWEYENRGQVETFRPYFSSVERNKLDRLIQRRTAWPKQCVLWLAELTADRYPFTKDEVLAQLTTEVQQPNPALTEMIHGKLYKETLSSLDKLGKTLDERFNSHPREILALNRRSPYCHMTEGMAEANVAMEQKERGFGDATRDAKIDLITTRRDNTLENYKPGRTKSGSSD